MARPRAKQGLGKDSKGIARISKGLASGRDLAT